MIIENEKDRRLVSAFIKLSEGTISLLLGANYEDEVEAIRYLEDLKSYGEDVLNAH